MSLFSRYIFRQVAGALLLILLSLTGVVWIALALKQLNLMTTQGQEAWLFFKITLLALPNLMALIAPIALLIATIHTLNRLNGDSELIVMTAGGATVWQFARPVLLLAMIVALAISFVNHFAMPWSMRQLRTYITQVRTDLISQVLQPGRFTAPENGLTIHIRERHRNGELRGILMHDERKPRQMNSYLAETGQILKDQAGTYLLMKNGHIIRKEKNRPASIIAFDSYPIDLSRMERRGGKINLKPRERYYHELIQALNDPKLHPDPKWHKKILGKFRSELHERFSSPLYPFAFVLIAIAFVGQAQSTRQNRVRSVVLAFMFSVGVRLSGLASMNLVTISALAVPLVYAIPLAAILAASITAQRKMLPRQSSRLSRVAADLFDRMIERFARKGFAPPSLPDQQALNS